MDVLNADGRKALPSADDLRERSLLARIAARDREAMRQFYLIYHGRLARFLTRVTRQREIVEEAINDTLLIVWQRAGLFRGESRVSTWVMGIAWRNASKGRLREKRAALSEGTPDEMAGAYVPFDRLETSEWLTEALDQLSPEQRATVDLAYAGGYSCEEIGAIMKCPENTVKTRLFYARAALRRALTEPEELPRSRARSASS